LQRYSTGEEGEALQALVPMAKEIQALADHPVEESFLLAVAVVARS
jgi:hypothetical protein